MGVFRQGPPPPSGRDEDGGRPGLEGGGRHESAVDPRPDDDHEGLRFGESGSGELRADAANDNELVSTRNMARELVRVFGREDAEEMAEDECLRRQEAGDGVESAYWARVLQLFRPGPALVATPDVRVRRGVQSS